MDENLIERFQKALRSLNDKDKPITEILYSPIGLNTIVYDWKFQFKFEDKFYVFQEINPHK